LDPHAVELTEPRVGRQLGVEDKLFGKPGGPLLAELDEAKNLVILLVAAQLAVGIAEHSGVGVVGQEREYPLLAPASLRDVVRFDDGILAVERDRVEVQVERRPPLQPQTTYRVEPASHQARVTAELDAA